MDAVDEVPIMDEHSESSEDESKGWAEPTGRWLKLTKCILTFYRHHCRRSPAHQAAPPLLRPPASHTPTWKHKKKATIRTERWRRRIWLESHFSPCQLSLSDQTLLCGWGGGGGWWRLGWRTSMFGEVDGWDLRGHGPYQGCCMRRAQICKRQSGVRWDLWDEETTIPRESLHKKIQQNWISSTVI